MGGQTLKPGSYDWLALADGLTHAQPRHGRERAACDAPRIDPRFHHPGRPRCPECLDRIGIVVHARVPAMTESEERLMDGNR